MPQFQQQSQRGNRALLASVALSFLMLLVSAAVLFGVARETGELNRLVVHTLEVKQSIGELRDAITSAESGQRGYLISRNPLFLRPYEHMRSTLEEQLRALRSLAGDNPEQLRRIDALTPILVERLNVMARSLELLRGGAVQETATLVSTRGQELMEQIRAHLDELDRTESELLIERQERAAVARERLIMAVTVVLFACAVLAIFALLSLRRYLAALAESRRRLANYNAELEARVRERTEDLARAAEVANRERARAEALLTDVNHRVGNNLALVSSFLTMQQRAVRHPDASRALGAARSRVQAIASAHRKLRLGSDFATVKANEVLGAVLEDISAGLPPGELIKIHCQVEPLEIHARDAVSLGVLTSELVMNAIKHAFHPGEAGEVSVVLGRAAGDKGPFLEVSDDGVGWDDEANQESGGLGARIIEMVARQFGGRPHREPRSPDGRRPGTKIRIELLKLQLMPQS